MISGMKRRKIEINAIRGRPRSMIMRPRPIRPLYICPSPGSKTDSTAATPGFFVPTVTVGLGAAGGCAGKVVGTEGDGTVWLGGVSARVTFSKFAPQFGQNAMSACISVPQ